MTSLSFLGIDIAKRTFAAVLLPAAGKPQSKSFDNTPAGFAKLHDWCQRHGATPLQAALEAGTYGDDLALFLHQTGVRVSVINPARIHAFARCELSRTKTDHTDAAVIARFLATQQPAAWTPPARELRQLQALVRRLEAVQAIRQAEANRLDLEGPDSLIRPSLQQHLQHLDQQLDELRQLLDDHLGAHPSLRQQCDLLVSIPGIGQWTAARLLAELPQWKSLAGPRQAAAHAGLTPRHHQSGTSVRGASHLAKTGSSRLRRALYMPALVAIRSNPILKAFAQRLQLAGKAPKQIICAVMRKLLHIAFGVLKHEQPFDPNYSTTH